MLVPDQIIDQEMESFPGAKVAGSLLVSRGKLWYEDSTEKYRVNQLS